MSRILELIAEYSPNGVEFKELGEVAHFTRGKGLSKADKGLGDTPIILYGELYTEYDGSITSIVSHTSSDKAVKSTSVHSGDILMPITSTTKEAEIGKASVLNVSEPVYLGGDALALRHEQDADFLVHLLNSNWFEAQKMRTVTGTTVMHLSPKKLAKIRVPVPPIEVQKAVSKSLNIFTKLDRSLKAELSARKRQYEYYRNYLMEFDNVANPVKLSDIAYYSDTRIPAVTLSPDTYIGVDNLLQDRQGKSQSNYVPSTGNYTEYNSGDILLGNIRPYLKKIWHATSQGGTNGDVLVIRLRQSYRDSVDTRYLYHVLASDHFFTYNMQYSRGAKMPRGSKEAIMKYSIYLPDLAKQKHIASLLDKFDELTSETSVGLPTEIKARQKQYEFYREKLVTFQELTA